MKYFIIFLVSIALLPGKAYAEMLWSDFSVSYLRGDHYQVGDKKRQVVTFEHAAATSWGDSFLFIDRLQSSNGDNETYGEWSPRLKLSDNKIGPFEQFFIAGTAEFGAFSGADGFTNSFTHYLMGVGTNVKIPGFDFFKWNVYLRNNDGADNGFQTTISWGVPVGGLYYDGFMDYALSTDNQAATLNFTSQLKYNIGPAIGFGANLFIGIEYVFWQNKFGIDDINERNLNLLVKMHF